jgi:ribokinase
MTDVMVVGSINSDVSYHVASLPTPGQTVLGTNRLDAPGGKGANQAVALAALGVSVEMVGAVGVDDRGHALIEHLAKQGVGTGFIATVPQSPTGSAVIVVSEDGENSIVVHPGSNLDVTPAMVEAALHEAQPGFVMAQFEIPLDAVLAATKASGTVVVNPAPMPEPSPELSQIIAQADILVPNRTELAALAGCDVPESIESVRECVTKLDFDGQLVVTLGAEGALVFDAGSHSEGTLVAAPRVNAIDASGAGDAFCAALVAGLHAGKSLIDATEYACEFAAWTTTQEGAQLATSAPSELRPTPLS